MIGNTSKPCISVVYSLVRCLKRSSLRTSSPVFSELALKQNRNPGGTDADMNSHQFAFQLPCSTVSALRYIVLIVFDTNRIRGFSLVLERGGREGDFPKVSADPRIEFETHLQEFGG